MIHDVKGCGRFAQKLIRQGHVLDSISREAETPSGASNGVDGDEIGGEAAHPGRTARADRPRTAMDNSKTA